MRVNFIATTAIGLLLAGAAQAQTPSAPQKPAAPPSTSTQEPAPRSAVRSVAVVEINELPEATRSQLNDLVRQRSADEQSQLQQAIEGAPMVKTAVEAKGFRSSDVVLAQVTDAGVLTVVTRRAG